MKSFTSAFAALSILASSVAATEWVVNPDQDFEEECLMKVQPGDSCMLMDGDHKHDGLTRTHGEADNRITIRCESFDACIKGSNTQDRALQIAHDYYTVEGCCFDGSHGGDEYVATAIYVLGADEASTKQHGLKASVTGTELIDLEIKNWDQECIHLRYFVTFTEIKGCTVQYCGRHAFQNGGGGAVGEAVYVGTALDQTGDSKAPEVKLRTGGADNVDVDITQKNWIHDNTFRTYGNECVDVKEGSTLNLIENNVCEQQFDENSGCFGSRGSGNTFRYNKITGCLGAGVRVGGDKGYGSDNNIYDNEISDCEYGAFNVMAEPQGKVCGNKISLVDTVTQGSEKVSFNTETVSNSCADDDTPGDIEEFGTKPSQEELPDSVDAASEAEEEDTEAEGTEEVNVEAPDSDDETTVEAVPLEEETDDEICAGVNCLDEGDTDLVVEIETNSNSGTTGFNDYCGSVLKVVKVKSDHYTNRDMDTEPGNLFDDNLETYYSVNKESTAITLELEEEADIHGVSIGFFMKDVAEERIQTFDIAVRSIDSEYETMYSREESSGGMGDMQHFAFTRNVKALYVKIESHGNTVNNWTAYTEIEVCGVGGEESNALFGGVRTAKKEIAALAGEVCAEPEKLTVKKSKGTGHDNIRQVFDGNFETRWTSQETTNDNDLDNAKIMLTFEGDKHVSHVEIAFFDGHLARPHFGLYKQAAGDAKWTAIQEGLIADKTESFQRFDVNKEGVNVLYIVGNGNDVGDFTKISEIAVFGC